MKRLPAFLLVALLFGLALLPQPARLENPPGPQAPLVPRTVFEGPALELDFPSVHIGVAEYEEGPTGATVFYFPKRAFAAVDVRGGAPGTILAAGLRWGYTETSRPFVDAISFAGGSAYGLEAASGVAAELLARRNFSNRWNEIAIVPGAIVFDFNRRTNAIYPDKELGRAALRAARPGRFPLGRRGAGRFVHAGGFFSPRSAEPSGQGGAFRQVGPTKIAVFTVVNSVGAVVDRQGRVVNGNRDPETGCRTPIDDDLRRGRRSERFLRAPDPPTPNTTITLVVTNQKLAFSELQRLAIHTHTALARAIQPFHTPFDGDTLFAVTTWEVDNPELSVMELAAHAADLAWEAALSSVPRAEAASPR